MLPIHNIYLLSTWPNWAFLDTNNEMSLPTCPSSPSVRQSVLPATATTKRKSRKVLFLNVIVALNITHHMCYSYSSIPSLSSPKPFPSKTLPLTPAYAILAIIFISGDLPFCLCVHPSHWTEASFESTRVVRDACLDKHNHHHHWSAPNRIRMRERLGDT